MSAAGGDGHRLAVFANSNPSERVKPKRGPNFDDRVTGASDENHGWSWRRIDQWHGMRQVAELFCVQFVVFGVRRDLNLDRSREPSSEWNSISVTPREFAVSI